MVMDALASLAYFPRWAEFDIVVPRQTVDSAHQRSKVPLNVSAIVRAPRRTVVQPNPVAFAASLQGDAMEFSAIVEM